MSARNAPKVSVQLTGPFTGNTAPGNRSRICLRGAAGAGIELSATLPPVLVCEPVAPELPLPDDDASLPPPPDDELPPSPDEVLWGRGTALAVGAGSGVGPTGSAASRASCFAVAASDDAAARPTTMTLPAGRSPTAWSRVRVRPVTTALGAGAPASMVVSSTVSVPMPGITTGAPLSITGFPLTASPLT